MAVKNTQRSNGWKILKCGKKYINLQIENSPKEVKPKQIHVMTNLCMVKCLNMKDRKKILKAAKQWHPTYRGKTVLMIADLSSETMEDRENSTVVFVCLFVFIIL